MLLVFNVVNDTSLWMTLTLGRCSAGTSAIPSSDMEETRSPPIALPTQQRQLGQHYVIINFHCTSYGELPKTSLEGLTSPHSCQHDHLEFTGAEYRRTYVGGARHHLGPVGSEPQAILLFKRSTLDEAGGALELYFEHFLPHGNFGCVSS